ncbi:Inositol 2-dehydrogenase [Novipirellula artificiosorum]|uniref:Inositol 2-dehydrogenase n=2 Tax=Novipirellula artificiosorum TaxID=2528016 RepID=A0A5C6DC57_9BACT|nr:Inositol 2-dehydrogenase [Novipirellula artificiosorum]
MMLAGGAIGGGNLAVARAAHSFGSDTIKIGLVGCGARGTRAAIEALHTTGGETQLVAMADVFADNLHAAYRTIRGKHPHNVDVQDTRFIGLEGYKQVFASDADVVILATPPGFRPQHFEAAVDAGKHVFMEKPVATDAFGVQRILSANAIAKQNNLAVQVGLQRRHEARYQQCIKRLHDGVIGEPLFARAYWNGSGVWVRPRTKDQSELDYQIRNWYYFTWLSGDHIAEQHIHNLDVINWVMKGHPNEAQGQGGREVRRGPDHGQIFDHHMVEFTYAGGATLLSQCRHIKGCSNRIGEYIHGTKGTADLSGGILFDANGDRIWEFGATDVKAGRGTPQLQVDLFAALRRGEIPNEADEAAHSTMTAILGRIATYTGKVVHWDTAIKDRSRLADTDVIRSLSDQAPVYPDQGGTYPIAIPGIG